MAQRQEPSSVKCEYAHSQLPSTRGVDYVIVPVNGKETLAAHRLPAGFAHQMAEGRVVPLKSVKFFFKNGSSAITFNAAPSFAGTVITGEVLAHHFFGDQYVPNLHYCAESVIKHY